jgi:hypothetical protein
MMKDGLDERRGAGASSRKSEQQSTNAEKGAPWCARWSVVRLPRSPNLPSSMAARWVASDGSRSSSGFPPESPTLVDQLWSTIFMDSTIRLNSHEHDKILYWTCRNQ